MEIVGRTILGAKIDTKNRARTFFTVRALFCPVFVPVFGFAPCFCRKSTFLRPVFALFLPCFRLPFHEHRAKALRNAQIFSKPLSVDRSIVSVP